MSRTFKVGDRVRFVCPGNPCSGEESAISSVLVAASASETFCFGGWFAGETIYELADLETATGKPAASPARYLFPLYDGNQLVRWESCIWQPLKVRA